MFFYCYKTVASSAHLQACIRVDQPRRLDMGSSYQLAHRQTNRETYSSILSTNTVITSVRAFTEKEMSTHDDNDDNPKEAVGGGFA